MSGFKLYLPKPKRDQIDTPADGIEDAEVIEHSAGLRAKGAEASRAGAGTTDPKLKDVGKTNEPPTPDNDQGKDQDSRTRSAPQTDTPPVTPLSQDQSTAVAAMQKEERSIIWRQKSRDQYEFMPPLLEIMERPASPLGRIVLWLTCLMFGAAIAWAAIGKVDIVAVAPGVIQPKGGALTLQAGMSGTVSQVLVSEGDRVEKGDLLMTLDDREARVPLDQVDERLGRLALKARINDRILEMLGSPVPNTMSGYPMSDDLIDLAHRQAEARFSRFRADIGAFDAEVTEVRGQLESARAAIYAHEASMPLFRSHVENMLALSEKGLVRNDEALRLRITLEDREAELRAVRVNHDNLLARLETLAARRDARNEAERFTAIEALIDAEQNGGIARLEKERLLTTAERVKLFAPTGGIISQVEIKANATIPQPGMPVMMLLPDTELEVEANLPARDIGFVEEGMKVAVKIAAYPFTRFGHIEGVVSSVSADTVHSGDGAGPAVYSITVSLADDALHLDDQSYPIGPGMEVSADIRTGERTVLDYFLSPITAKVEETLRER
jgi:hemolysin D